MQLSVLVSGRGDWLVLALVDDVSGRDENNIYFKSTEAQLNQISRCLILTDLHSSL